MQNFEDIWDVCEAQGQIKIKGILANYGLDKSSFTDKYESLKFNIERECEPGTNETEVSVMILNEMEQALQEEQKAQGAVRQQKATYRNDGQNKPDEIFNAIAQCKNQRNQQKAANAGSKENKNGTNSKGPASNAMGYSNRQSRGQHRASLNDSVARIPGIYNDKASVEIEPVSTGQSESVVQPYDFFNLNAQSRTNAMQNHFEEVEKILLTQLQTEAFDEFGAPTPDCVRIIGRIVNISTEDNKLKPDSIGIMNTSDEGAQTFKLKLNVSEVPQFSLFEGEIVVAEGVQDSNSKFNVNKIFKPVVEAINQKPLYDFDYLKRCQQSQQQKALSCMVAAGPFTTADSLQYDALRDLMQIVARDRPHTLLLLGPFLDGNNQDIKDADICFSDKSGQVVFMDYDDLFQQIMTYIQKFLTESNLTTKVVIVPSAREISHIHPLPQPGYAPTLMPKEFEPVLLGNPQTFRINDITVGVLNADIVKDLCMSMVVKDLKVPKIDSALKSVLEQRTFYPLYPGNPSSPIDWEQYKHMMFPNGQVPDVLITPSDLMLYAKNIEGVVCVNPGMLVKGQAAGSYATLTIDPITLPQADYEGKGLPNKAHERVRIDVINI